MRIVLDAPAVAAALLHPDGRHDTTLQRPDVEGLLPALLLRAVDRRQAELRERAGCTAAEWESRVDWFLSTVDVVEDVEVQAALDHKLAEHAAQATPMGRLLAATLVTTNADRIWTPDEALHEALPGAAVPDPLSSLELASAP